MRWKIFLKLKKIKMTKVKIKIKQDHLQDYKVKKVLADIK